MPCRVILASLAVALAMFVAPTSASAQTVSPAETQAIAKDAYVYSYAMLESYQTWRTQTVDKTAQRICRRLQRVPALLGAG